MKKEITDKEQTIAELTLGKATLGDQANENLLAYIVRDEETIYVDESDLDIVASQLGAAHDNRSMTIRKGAPFKGSIGFALVCDIKTMSELPMEKLVGLGDGKVLQGNHCVVRPAGACFNQYKNGVFRRSFKAPSYGMSLCAHANDTCDTWVAQETVEVFQQKNCQGPSANKKISAYVCSMP